MTKPRWENAKITLQLHHELHLKVKKQFLNLGSSEDEATTNEEFKKMELK